MAILPDTNAPANVGDTTTSNGNKLVYTLNGWLDYTTMNAAATADGLNIGSSTLLYNVIKYTSDNYIYYVGNTSLTTGKINRYNKQYISQGSSNWSITKPITISSLELLTYT